VCCSVLQCVAGCCSVLQCVAVCCSVLQCVAVCCSVLQSVAVWCNTIQHTAMHRSTLRDTAYTHLYFCNVSFDESTHLNGGPNLLNFTPQCTAAHCATLQIDIYIFSTSPLRCVSHLMSRHTSKVVPICLIQHTTMYYSTLHATAYRYLFFLTSTLVS